MKFDLHRPDRAGIAFGARRIDDGRLDFHRRFLFGRLLVGRLVFVVGIFLFVVGRVLLEDQVDNVATPANAARRLKRRQGDLDLVALGIAQRHDGRLPARIALRSIERRDDLPPRQHRTFGPRDFDRFAWVIDVQRHLRAAGRREADRAGATVIARGDRQLAAPNFRQRASRAPAVRAASVCRFV